MAIGNTILGSPNAGCILLAHNLANLGRVRAARYVMIVGALATSIALGISYVLWRTFMHPPIWYGMMTAMLIATLLLDGGAYRRHLAQGGAQASNVAAVRVGITCFAVLVALFILIEMIRTATILAEQSNGP